MIELFVKSALLSTLFICCNAWFIQKNGNGTLNTKTSKTVTGSIKNDNTDAECCIQDEWEGLIYVDNGHVFIDADTFMAYINGTMHVAYSVHEAKFYYEFNAVEQTPLLPKPQKAHMIILRDYKMGVSYTVSDGECQKEDMPKNMTKVCIPSDATLLSRGEFTDIAKVTETYQFVQYYQDFPIQITATVLRSGSQDSQAVCEPFYGSYFVGINNPDSGDLYTFNVMDRGPIKSKHVFDVPKPCQHL